MLLLITKGLKVYHAHNMKKKIQRDISSYLKRSRGDTNIWTQFNNKLTS